MNRTRFTIAITILTTLGAATLSTAALRPTQVLMQARAGWLKGMNEAVQKKDFATVVKHAQELSNQTATVARNLDGERQQLTQRVSELAREAGEAAKKKDEAGVKGKLAEIKGTCATCHDKYRK
ncbi:MAG: hypothetical protein Fur0034_06000 [Desulfuromonadia bacterium]